jgi:hypothetical protein
MTTVTKTAMFQDLPETQKERIIEQHMELMDVDLSFVRELIQETCATMFGTTMYDIAVYYAVEGSDDYVAFEGPFQYNNGAVKQLKEEFPTSTEFHRILAEWQKLQQKHFYKLNGNTRSGRSYMHVDTYKRNDTIGHDEWVSRDIEKEMSDILHDLANVFLTWLREEYAHQTSRESVIEMLTDQEFLIENEE